MLHKLVLSTLLFLWTFAAHAQPYTNLALKGGGIRGIAYTGAVKVLEEKGITVNLQNIAGTSSGAIVGTLVAVSYTAGEMQQIMLHLKIQRFNDGGWIFIGGQRRMRKHYGWYKGNAMERWIGKLIEQRTGNANLTFRQLHDLALRDKKYKNLFITATDLTAQKVQVFSWQTYPDMMIKTAVRASFSVPLYFEAVVLDSVGHKIKGHTICPTCHVFVDGGIVANYPLNIFDTGTTPNMQTLGLNLERPEQMNDPEGSIATYHIAGFRSYVGALYNITIETLNRNNTIAHEQERTIYISTSNLSPKVRKIKKHQKLLLYNNGVHAATKFLEPH